MNDEELAVLALAYGTPGLTPARLRAALDEADTAVSALGRACPDGIDGELDAARARAAYWQSQGMRVIACVGPDYPDQLLDVCDYPPVIFTRGALPAGGAETGLAVVGSRHAQPPALAQAREVAAAAVQAGYSVVSGLAAGIDTAAHQAALAGGGRTVAVVGTGLDQPYPRRNAPLQADIVDAGGLIVSQFAPGTPTRPSSFPMRNATMSGYALATVVIAAAEKSGTRHQVRAALKHGRPVIVCPQVAAQTTWGKALADDPLADVEVAHSPDEVVRLLTESLTLPPGILPDAQLALI